MALKAKAEYIIEDVAGCGRFQITFFLSVVVVIKLATSYSIMFMAFGNYNPGWRCLDNVTESTSSLTNDSGLGISTTDDDVSTENRKLDDYEIGSCNDYRKCDDVEFNPASSSIVTEWGLVCDKAWVVSLIISLQMLGMLIGSYGGGQLSDLIGRKKTACIGLLICSVCQLISAFSVSWVMLSVMRFFIGIFTTSTLVMMFIFVSEFMTRKWRAETIAVPVWAVGATLLAFVAWLCKDWRKIEFTGSCMNCLCLIPTIFIAPESLRWLEVKNKRKQFIKVSGKVLKMNSKKDASLEEWNAEETGPKEINSKRYTIVDLFRKGYKIKTVCIVFLQFSFSLLYYATTFGAKSLYGDFYFNLFVSSITSVPVGILSIFVLRLMTRKGFTVAFLSATIVCSIASVVILLAGDRAAKDFGSTVLISVAKSALDAGWSGVFALNTELYPTVVRGVAVGVGSMSARIGGIVAPFLIPDDESVLYIFMIIMTALTVLCCGIILKLPETKGTVLKETFHDDGKEQAANERV